MSLDGVEGILHLYNVVSGANIFHPHDTIKRIREIENTTIAIAKISGNRAASILNFKFSSAHLILSRSEVVELLFAFSLCFGDKLSLYRSSIYCLSAIFQLYL